jgi:CIC family chloride channel protein
MTQNWLHDIRLRLADSNSQIHHAALGVISGVTCSIIVLLFRYMLEGFGLWLPDGNEENFEDLPRWMHFALPLAGALILGWIMRKLNPIDIRAGTVHVISRLHHNQGHLPLRNTVWQFFAGGFALATGQSGGREGPAIHLGAGANSLLADWLHLPNNTRRILVGCGTAAAIAGSFNTPIAGVIFAMEVVMMEYTIAGFIPVILAATTATAITQAFFGSEPILTIGSLHMESLAELPYIALMGLLIGSFAALFIAVLKFALSHNKRPVMQRMLIAGLVTGSLALLAPGIMGVGYDTLNQALAGQLPLTVLLLLVFAKIFATTVSVGMGLPVGLIGPSFLIGSGIGAAMGIIGAYFYPDASGTSFYVLLGMGAMMGAVMNAPLAALLALVELTHNSNIIFPGMLVIAIASITRSSIFTQPSASQAVLDNLNRILHTDPVSLALQRTSVATLMSYDLRLVPNVINRCDVQEMIDHPTHWIVIAEDNHHYLLQGAELAESLTKRCQDSDSSSIELDELNLNKIPTKALSLRSTLREALDTMGAQQTDIVLIFENLPHQQQYEIGVVTRSDIIHYVYPRSVSNAVG